MTGYFEAIIVLGIICIGQQFLLYRAMKSHDLSNWRMSLIKGLSPACEKPDDFGPKVMAEAHNVIQRQEAPPTFLDDDVLAAEQMKRWQVEAEEYARQQQQAGNKELAEQILKSVKNA